MFICFSTFWTFFLAYSFKFRFVPQARPSDRPVFCLLQLSALRSCDEESTGAWDDGIYCDIRALLVSRCPIWRKQVSFSFIEDKLRRHFYCLSRTITLQILTYYVNQLFSYLVTMIFLLYLNQQRKAKRRRERH